MSLRTLIPVIVLILAGCSDSGPYLSFAGGGFVVNYRIAEIYYGFVAKPERRLPDNASIEASFENPAGGPPIVMATPVEPGQLQYMFRTPALKGVVKDRDYKVELKLLDKATGKIYETASRTFRSTADQATLPDKPLVVGPGYMPNPENDITQKP